MFERYRSDERVVFASCRDGGANSLAFQVDENNTVTHFKTDQPGYFELKLTDLEVEEIMRSESIMAPSFITRFQLAS